MLPLISFTSSCCTQRHFFYIIFQKRESRIKNLRSANDNHQAWRYTSFLSLFSLPSLYTWFQELETTLHSISWNSTNGPNSFAAGRQFLKIKILFRQSFQPLIKKTQGSQDELLFWEASLEGALSSRYNSCLSSWQLHLQGIHFLEL